MTIKYSSNDKLTEEDKISFKKLVEEIADISEMERDIPTDMERYISIPNFNQNSETTKIINALYEILRIDMQQLGNYYIFLFQVWLVIPHIYKP